MSSRRRAQPDGERVMSLLPIDYDLLVQRLLPDAFLSVAKHIGPVLCYRGDPQDPDASAYIGGVDALLAWCREEYAYEDADKIFYERLAKTARRGRPPRNRPRVLRLGRRGGRLRKARCSPSSSRTSRRGRAPTSRRSCGARLAAREDDEPGRAQNVRGVPRAQSGARRLVPDRRRAGRRRARGQLVAFGEKETFADETFKVKHDAPGVLSMVSGKKHGNGGQFTALAPLPFLTETRRPDVIDGLRVMKLVNRERLTFAEKPVRDVRLGKCEMVTFALEAKAPTEAEE